MATMVTSVTMVPKVTIWYSVGIIIIYGVRVIACIRCLRIAQSAELFFQYSMRTLKSMRAWELIIREARASAMSPLYEPFLIGALIRQGGDTLFSFLGEVERLFLDVIRQQVLQPRYFRESFHFVHNKSKMCINHGERYAFHSIWLQANLAFWHFGNFMFTSSRTPLLEFLKAPPYKAGSDGLLQ